MSTLGVGTRVMLIGTDGYMPPLGSRGVVVSEVDKQGDCDVLFPGFPCPNPPDSSWIAHESWLIPLDDGDDMMDEIPRTLAEREGFEPSIPETGIPDFESGCAGCAYSSVMGEAGCAYSAPDAPKEPRWARFPAQRAPD